MPSTIQKLALATKADVDIDVPSLVGPQRCAKMQYFLNINGTNAKFFIFYFKTAKI